MRRFFEGQHKHVYIGRVIAENQNCLILLGRSFHFRKIASSGAMDGELVKEASGLSSESVSERAIPWAHPVWAPSGNIVLDDKNKTFVTSTRDHGE